MLETERAGAKALVVFLEDHDRQGEAWKLLRRVQADEARNCALIGKLLDKSRVAHSHATGDFYEKAVAIRGGHARLEFLVRGLRWAVRRFDEALPRLDGEASAQFEAMKTLHLRSIAACEQVAGRLPEP